MKKITKESRNIVLAMALGDGYLSSSGILSIRHAIIQKEYLEWKKNILNQYGINTTELYYVDNNGYGAYELRTYTNEFIKVMRRRLYKPSKKISQLDVLKTLTPLGLSIWYMDDGGLSQKKKDGKVHGNDLMLNTHLTYEENAIIIQYFKDVWDINFTQCKNKGKYRLRCGTKEARKFINIVEPFVKQVPCMMHKINIKS